MVYVCFRRGLDCLVTTKFNVDYNNNRSADSEYNNGV